MKTWSGKSPDVKAKIIKGITKVFEDLGTPTRAVTVIVVDIPKNSWGMNGKPADTIYP